MIGWMEQEHGTVEVAPGGLVYAGLDPDQVRSLSYRLQGWLWAVFVDPVTGLTEDQPEYD